MLHLSLFIMPSRKQHCTICNVDGHTKTNKVFHPTQTPVNEIQLNPPALAPTPEAVANNVVQPESESILKFDSSKGKGRGENDSNNKVREHLLTHLLTPACDPCMTADSPHAEKWNRLRNEWKTALDNLAERLGITNYTSIHIEHKGGRGENSDFLVTYIGSDYNKPVKVEFKFNEMPQFLNLPANRPIHPTSYAEFYYNNYLDRVLEILEILLSEKPTYAAWVKYLYNNDASKHPLYVRMKEAEKTCTQASNLKKAIQTGLVAQSIREYLEQVKDFTNCEYLTQEFQKQSDKHFLIYNYTDGKFHYDTYTPNELTVKSVSSVINGNTLVLESNHPGTYHHCLLRWKNHQGILFPAWQIKLVRQ